jgi:sodium-dependent dicarboxylate transporter 2/3/5
LGITFGEAGLLIDHELEQLGEMSKGERIVLIVFVTTAICWMTRQWSRIYGFYDAGCYAT